MFRKLSSFFASKLKKVLKFIIYDQKSSIKKTYLVPYKKSEFFVNYEEEILR